MYPDYWDSSISCDYNLKDVVAGHFALMGSSSMNSHKIVRFFIEDGINPLVTYPGHSPTIEDRVNSMLSHKIYHADAPMRSAKFLSEVLNRTPSSELESIMHGLVLISRLSS